MKLQAIDKKSALLCLEVEKFCRKLGAPAPGQKIAIAFSGGSDSTALTLIFHMLAPRLRCELAAIHINHHLRDNARLDQLFCRKLCRGLAIPLHEFDLDAAALARETRTGIEEAARNGRLRVFKSYVEAGKADYILTGHQADDLCEDIFMRLVRGAGWPALGGMKAREGIFLRPLLGLDSASIKAFLRRMGQTWREDESNQSLEYRRNRIRHLVIPLALKENPALARAMGHLHELAGLDADFWNKYLEDFLTANPWREGFESCFFYISLKRKALENLEPAARLRLYHKILKYMAAKTINIGMAAARADTLFKLDEALASGAGGKIFQFPGAIEAAISGKNLVFKARLRQIINSQR